MIIHSVMVGILFLIVYGAMALFGKPVWWVALGVALVGYGVLRLGIGYAIKSLFLAPFKAKGAALREAEATVHSIFKVPAPVRKADEGDETPSPDRTSWNYYQLDVTVTPKNQASPFTHWEPGELRLVPFDAKTGLDADEDDNQCIVESIEIFEAGVFKEYDGAKFPGPQRVRFLTGIHPDHQRLKFLYYFESFGNITLPN